MNHRVPLLAAALALAAIAVPPASAAAAASAASAASDASSKVPAGSAIALGDFMGRKRTIEVEVAGQRGTFLVDTGGGVTLVSLEFARRIGCKPWGQISGFRLTGERLDLPRCDDVRIVLPDGTALPPVTAAAIDLASVLAKGDDPVDGSLALDALDGTVFTLDVGAGTLQFETPASLQARIATAVEVPVRIGRYGSSARGVAAYVLSRTAKGDLWLELDTGGDAPVLLPTSMAAEAGADPAIQKGQPYVLTVAGTGRDVAQETRAVVRDMVRDGVIGMPVLVRWRLTFDLAHDRLWIAPSR
jgi:predicted aspartyl protease